MNYRNPWKFEVGDLVECSTLELHLMQSPSTNPDLKPGTGMIIDRRRKSYHVEARPIRIVEADEYCMTVGSDNQWAPVEALSLAQKKPEEIK
jgi:hypothetical protein